MKWRCGERTKSSRAPRCASRTPGRRSRSVMFLAVIGATAIAAGGIAAVTGFGIGSLLTPLFAVRYDMRLAVAAVSIPHAVATALRLWILRRNVDRRVLQSFGLMSAAGGLAGALLQRAASGRGLTIV